MVPDVTSMSPSSLARGATNVAFTITGKGFQANPNSYVFGATGVTWTVTGVTDTTVTGLVTVAPTAPTGAVAFRVANVGTGPGLGAATAGVCLCLTIT